MSGPLAYTTVVPVSRTVAEITTMLGEHGADAIGITYADKRPTGINFLLPTPTGQSAFALPVNAAGTLRLLRSTKESSVRPKHRTPEQAERVAWRVVRQWLEAQLALVDAQIASLDQIMLPYRQVDGRSVYELVTEQQRAAIGAGR
jgi:hypothetical protein